MEKGMQLFALFIFDTVLGGHYNKHFWLIRVYWNLFFLYDILIMFSRDEQI